MAARTTELRPALLAAPTKQDLLFALAAAAEADGFLAAAIEISKWAESQGPFVPYSDDEMRSRRGGRRA